MSLPTSIRAYEDCRELFEAAAADPKGARACVGTYDAAINMRTRLHYFRKLDANANAETYPEGHPNHATSVYYTYVVKMLKDEDDNWWLYIQPRTSAILTIEGLSEPHLQPTEEET